MSLPPPATWPSWLSSRSSAVPLWQSASRLCRQVAFVALTTRSEGRVTSQQRPICVKNLCDRRHIDAGIRDQENDPIVHGVLKHLSISEAQAYTSGSLRAAADDPATAAKRARPPPAAEVDPRLVARGIAHSAAGQTVNHPSAIRALGDTDDVSIAPPVSIGKGDGMKFVTRDPALLDEVHGVWIGVMAAPAGDRGTPATRRGSRLPKWSSSWLSQLRHNGLLRIRITHGPRPILVPCRRSGKLPLASPRPER